MRSILETRPEGAPGRDKPVPYESKPVGATARPGGRVVVARDEHDRFAGTGQARPLRNGFRA